MLQNPKVHARTLPNVTPSLMIVPKIIPYLKTLSLSAEKVVSKYQKRARLPTFIRCKTPMTYLITLPNSDNTCVLPIIIHYQTIAYLKILSN